jgi:hypothetical protein
VKTKPKFVSVYRDRHGLLRWRFRRTGSPQSQTRAIFGTEDWWAWYAEACEARPKAIGQDRTKPGLEAASELITFSHYSWTAPTK